MRASRFDFGSARNTIKKACPRAVVGGLGCALLGAGLPVAALGAVTLMVLGAADDHRRKHNRARQPV